MLLARCVWNAVRAAAIVLCAMPLAGCPLATKAPLFDRSSGFLPLPAGAYETWRFSTDDMIWKRGDDAFLEVTGTTYVFGKAAEGGKSMAPQTQSNGRIGVSFHKLSDGNVIAQAELKMPSATEYSYAAMRFDAEYTHIYLIDCSVIKDRKLNGLLSREVMNEDGLCPDANRESIRAIAKVALDNLPPDSRMRRAPAK